MVEKLRQVMHFIRFLGLLEANKANHPRTTKRQLLKDYLFFKFNISKYFLCHKLHYFDHQTTVSLIESIFIDNEYFFECKNPNPTIYDLGSNIGLSIIYFKILYPRSTIHAFEPDPDTFTILQKNLSSYCLKDVHLHNLAITNQTGQINFFVNPTGSGSPLMSTNPSRLNGKKISVPSIKASDIIKTKIDFIKMDIEGSEISVLKDLDRSKKIKFVDQMSIEYHHHVDVDKNNLSNFLKILEKNNFGYQIHAAQNTPLIPKTFEDIKIHTYKQHPPFV